MKYFIVKIDRDDQQTKILDQNTPIYSLREARSWLRSMSMNRNGEYIYKIITENEAHIIMLMDS